MLWSARKEARFHLWAVVASMKFPSAPESRKTWVEWEAPPKDRWQGITVCDTGDVDMGKVHTRTLRSSGRCFLLVGTGRQNGQTSHNKSRACQPDAVVSGPWWVTPTPAAWVLCLRWLLWDPPDSELCQEKGGKQKRAWVAQDSAGCGMMGGSLWPKE